MPWLFSFERSTGRFGLSDIWSSKPNCFRELRISPELRNFNHSPGLPICTSKDGWLLLSKYVDKFSIEFLFCSPFHNKIIELPCLSLDVGEYVNKFMINSTHPAVASRNPDCVVAIIRRGKYYRVVTCNPRTRNKEWTSHMIPDLENVVPESWCSIYMDGTLYCVFQYGRQGALLGVIRRLTGMFCLAKQDSGDMPSMHFPLQPEEEGCDIVQLFESNGQLLLATLNLNPQRLQIGLYWRIYKFDPMRKDDRNHWFTPIESLGNRALAISFWPSDFSRDLVVVVHDAKEFADMILYGNAIYTRETDEGGTIWRKVKNQAWKFMKGSGTYIQPILFA